MKKLFTAVLLLAAYAGTGDAQTLKVVETTFYSNSNAHAIYYLHDVIQTADKGFVFAGMTGGPGGGPFPVCTTPPPTSFAGRPIWGKLDSTGAIQWVKHLCDTPVAASTVCQTPDDGYVHNGGTRPWNSMSIFRYDAAGNYLWRRDYGKNADCHTIQIINTPDHGFLLLGLAKGIDTDITVNYQWPPIAFQPEDWVVIKLDSLGSKQWVRTLGTSGYEEAAKLLCDGKNYYLIGATQSKDHDCADVAGHPYLTIYTIKLDSAGNKIWTMPRGSGTVSSVLFDERDNTIMVASTSKGGHEYGPGNTTDDFALMKLDTAGNYKWGKLYGEGATMNGGGYVEQNPAICKAPNGGYFLAGDKYGYGSSTTAHRGLLLSIDSMGNKIDERTIASNIYDAHYEAIFPVTGSVYRAFGQCNGQTLSEGIGQNAGSNALMVSKLALVPLGLREIEKSVNDFTLCPNPTTDNATVRLHSAHRGGELTCINADGKTVYQQSLRAWQSFATLTTSRWLPGAYAVCWQPVVGARQCTTLIVR